MYRTYVRTILNHEQKQCVSCFAIMESVSGITYVHTYIHRYIHTYVHNWMLFISIESSFLIQLYYDIFLCFFFDWLKR